MSIEDKPKFKIVEEMVLEKFDGEPTPENLFERIYIRNGEIIRVEKIKEVE